MELISYKQAWTEYGLTPSMLTYYVRTNKITKEGAKFYRKSIVEYLDTFKVKDIEGEIWKPIPNFEKYNTWQVTWGV